MYMDSILEGTTKKSKFKQIMVERVIAEKLEKLNKGSYNKAISFILDSNPDNQIKLKVEDNQDEIIQLQQALKVISLNHLKS